MNVQTWATAPANTPPDLLPGPELVTVCADPDCVRCQAAAAGARAIAAAVGVNYDTVDQHVRDHYSTIAASVMAAMSEVLLNYSDTGQEAH